MRGIQSSVVVLAASAALALAPAGALASAGDILVGGDDGANTVLRIKPNGSHQIVAGGAPLTAPAGLDFAPDGTIFVSDYGLPGLVKVDPTAHTAKSVVTGTPFSSATDAVRGPDGQFYVIDNPAEAIFRVNPVTKTATSINADVPGATALTLDGKGNLLVAGNGVFKVNRQTGATALVPGTDTTLIGGSGIVRSPSGTVYVNKGGDTIFKVDLATGNLTPVASGDFLGSLYDMDIEPDGKLLAAADLNVHALIVRVNPKNGKQSVVNGGTLGDGAAEGLRIEPPSCGGKLATIVGSTKSDHLKGTKFDDVIAGLGARDVIDGGGGKDIICGGGGKDNISGGGGKDTVNGGTGEDSCIGERLTSC